MRGIGAKQLSGANLVRIAGSTLLSDRGDRSGDTGDTAHVNGTRNWLNEHDAYCGSKNPNGRNVTPPYQCEEMGSSPTATRT
jgi:hypothetical protein